MRNEIKLQFYEPRFIINEETGVVVCKIDYAIHYPDQILNNCRELPIYNTARGIARLSEGDSFDLVKGKKIALTKAERKAYEKVGNFCSRLKNLYFESLRICSRFCDKADSVIEHNTDYLDTF